MLIAIMGDTFDRVTQNRVSMVMQNRIQIIVENRFLFDLSAKNDYYIFKKVDDDRVDSGDEWTNRF